MVAAKKSEYEASRQKRLEENKKRMEELNLTGLAQSLLSPKPSPMKKVKPRSLKVPLDPSKVRRSNRVADMPPISYKEAVPEPAGRVRSYGRHRDLSNRVYASDEAREYARSRAEELQSQLDQDIPSFVKPMLQSHVTGGFWLGLPQHFCRGYLPRRDGIMNLIDEEGHLSEAKYLAQKTGLSGGWRGFAIEHELVDGDSIIFQLTKPTTFKVYIIRVNEHEAN